MANPQMTNLIHLALAVLADLGFDKPAHVNDRRTVIFDGSRSSYGFAEETNLMDNEDRRTLLGCFYVTSVLVVRGWPHLLRHLLILIQGICCIPASRCDTI